MVMLFPSNVTMTHIFLMSEDLVTNITGLFFTPPLVSSTMARPDSTSPPLDFCDSEVALLHWDLCDWVCKSSRVSPASLCELFLCFFYEGVDWLGYRNKSQQDISFSGAVLGAVYSGVDNTSLVYGACLAKSALAN